MSCNTRSLEPVVCRWILAIFFMITGCTGVLDTAPSTGDDNVEVDICVGPGCTATGPADVSSDAADVSNGPSDACLGGAPCGDVTRPCPDDSCDDLCGADADCPDVEFCLPATCSSLGVECGEHDDECAGTVQCNECADDSLQCVEGICVSQCPDGDCTPAHCSNGLPDGNETDVDCGGPDCPFCPVWFGCGADTDCESGVCISGICRPPESTATCGDDQRNGDETDIDCGGRICPGCPSGSRCLTSADCESRMCIEGTCRTPAATCSNGVQDGTETGVDCGGPDCAQCVDGRTCQDASDCRSRACGDGVCCDHRAVIRFVSPQEREDDTCLAGNISGYRVLWGESSGNYSSEVLLTLDHDELYCAPNGFSDDCGPSTSCTYTVTGLTAGTWYFVTTAIDTDGVESAYSGEAAKTVFPCP